MTRYQHPPGHPQSVNDGCTCPVMDNGHGKGCGYVDVSGTPLFVFDMNCPLHGGDQAEEMNPEEMCFEDK